jgi:hypothetical protein
MSPLALAGSGEDLKWAVVKKLFNSVATEI